MSGRKWGNVAESVAWSRGKGFRVDVSSARVDVRVDVKTSRELIERKEKIMNERTRAVFRCA